MHFVYIACLLEMQGRENMAGQGRAGQGGKCKVQY